MSVAVVVVGGLLIWLALGSPVAVVLCRAIRLADERTTTSPPAGVRVGEEPRPRRGHLHAV